MNDQPRVLGGRYELGRVLGRGGMAQVRWAQDTRLGRPVAIKELRIDLASDHTFQARFRREAQAAAALNHPNIVAVYDTGEEVDPATSISVPYIVMELVEGRTLRDLLRDGQPIEPRRALEFAQGVLDALAYSHRNGIVHRDIKPANVMLTSNGMVKVMDFGIARAVSDTSSTMTQTAAVIGTAQYLSPEQARGETVDARSDIYSAGCLLYELLVGRPPFTGDSPVSVAYQHVREAPVPPSQLNPAITPEMDAVVLKSLAKDPADRYQTAGAMRTDVARLLAGQAPLAASLPMDAPTRAIPTAPASVATPAAPASAASATAVQTGPQTAVTGPQRAIEPEPQPKKRGLLWGIVGVLVLVVAGIIAGFLMLFSGPPAPKQVAVPYVYNEMEAVAIKIITDSGLTPKVDNVNGADDATVGKVVEQKPEQNTMVDEGTTVTIKVNRGPKKIAIPTGIKGMTVTEAKAKLESLGFKVSAEAATTEPAGAEPNTVLTVSPEEGVEAPLDSTVKLTYATGKLKVPTGLLNMTRADAKKTLEEAGFTVKEVPATKDIEQPNQKADIVLQVSPAEGQTASPDTPVTLTYSTGKIRIVPDLFNLSREEATAKLNELQITKLVWEEKADAATPGTVLGTRPSADRVISTDDELVVIVAAAPTPSESPQSEQPSSPTTP